MSDVCPCTRSGFLTAEKASRAPSGDHATESTLNAVPLVTAFPAAGAFMASLTSRIQICE